MAGIGEISRHAGVKLNDVRKVFEAIAAQIRKGNKVTIKHFGTFRLSRRKARKYNTPILGEFEVGEHFTTAFRANRDLRMIPIEDIEGPKDKGTGESATDLPPNAKTPPKKRTGSKLGKGKKKGKGK
jgi:nucleoid DNA-binding protein